MISNVKTLPLANQVSRRRLLEDSPVSIASIPSYSQASFNQTRLFNIVDLIAQGNLGTAQHQLNQLLDRLNISPASHAITHLIFARALAEHLSDVVIDKANLYLKPYEIPQIQLFNLLANQVPLVSLISELATDLLVEACNGRDDVTLMDIGIGTGRQMVDLLQKLAQQPCSPQRINIVGIEPSEQSLSLAQDAIATAANALGLDVTFTAFCNGIESLSDHDWQSLQEQCDRPIINASFALHHICDQAGQDVRTKILHQLHQLNPTLLVLSEPNTDHLEPDFRRRFQNCWRHYSNVFQMIDALAIDQQSKDGLKTCFFGREVVDVLKADNTARIERHETAQSWVNRLKQSGYTLQTPVIEDLLSSPVVTIQEHTERYLNFAYNGVPLVSLICAHA